MQLEFPFFSVDRPDGSAGRGARKREGASDPGFERVEFVRVRRARRYILRVRPDGTVRVTVPRGGSRREAEAFLRRHAQWIARERQRVRRDHAPVEWHAGSQILYRGRPTTITVDADGDGYVIGYGDRRVRAGSVQDIRGAVEHDLREVARQELVPRLHAIAADLGLTVGRVTIRNQRSRWGSCAQNGNIALNFRLVQMPAAVRDYVLVHELMHIRQQNHGPRFWKLVAAACPAYRECERWLRKEGRALF